MSVTSVGEGDILDERVASTVPSWSVPHLPFEDPGVCVAYVDRQLRMVATNPDFGREFDFDPDPDQAVGRSLVDDLLHPSMGEWITRQFALLCEGSRGGFIARMICVRADGSTFTGELTCIAMRNVHGHVGGMMVLLKPLHDGCPVLCSDDPPVLTEMDAQILEGIAAGMSTVKLGATLYLSRGGIEYHLNRLLRKLKVNNRPSLVSKAFSLGLLNAGSWPPKVLPEYIDQAGNRP